MNFPVRAITLDLDDTLWPFAPIGARIEQVVHEWFLAHSPVTAQRFPISQMRVLRERILADYPELAHDISQLRRLTLRHALLESGGDEALTDAVYEAFYEVRNQVEFYPDARQALARISARLPVAAVTNGNADLSRVGVSEHFAFLLGPREHGAAKPEASIFLAACQRLECEPGLVLHVGDHPEMDVLGAAGAGLRTCWINRHDETGKLATWPHDAPAPDLHFHTLGELADWLDANLSPEPEHARA